MKYVIVTVEWLQSKGITVESTWRKSVDKTKVVLHKNFVKPVLDDGEMIEEYSYDELALWDILNSTEWSKPIEESTNNIKDNV